MQRLLPQDLRSEAPFALRKKGVFLCEFFLEFAGGEFILSRVAS